MRDARPAEPRDALHGRRALNVVDGHGLVLAGAESVAVSPVASDRRDEMRPRDLAEVEAGEDGVAELQEPEAEPVAPALGVVLDEARPRASVASSRETVLALMPVRRAISFVPSSGSPVGERVEHRDGPLDGGDVADVLA